MCLGLCARLNIGEGLQKGIIHDSYPQRAMICYTEIRSKIFHAVHLGKIVERKPVPEEMGDKDGTTKSLPSKT